MKRLKTEFNTVLYDIIEPRGLGMYLSTHFNNIYGNPKLVKIHELKNIDEEFFLEDILDEKKFYQ